LIGAQKIVGMTKNVWEEHEFLFHYTTQAGLEGILNSQALHATHYSRLNDEAEMLALRPRLLEIIRDDVTNRLNGVVNSEIGKLVDGLYKITFGAEGRKSAIEPFVISFCSHKKGTYEFDHGLLSQWRAYTQDVGFAIVFETKPLAEMFLEYGAKFFHSGGHFSDVVYDGQEERFADEFRELIDAFKDFYSKYLFGKMNLDELYLPFTTSTARFKHRAFSEEGEVRIVYCPCDAAEVENMKKVSQRSLRK
jgi:hypothetical protein